MSRALLLAVFLSSVTGALAASNLVRKGPLQKNRMVWFDLASTDLGGSARLYHELFGWTFTPMANADDVMLIRTADHEIGDLRKEAQFTHSGAGVVYLMVDNVAAIASKARALGGTVRVRPQQLPNDYGWIAVVADPSGQPVGVWAPDSPTAR